MTRKLTSRALGSNSVTSDAIANDAITSNELADNIQFPGDYIVIPTGSTAERPASPSIGMLRYNTTLGFMEQYTVDGWQGVAPPPTIVSVSPTSYNGEQGTTITINGSSFDSNPTVKFITNDNSEYTASVVSRINSSQLAATTPQDFTVAQEPLKVKVINGSGLSYTLENAIDCGGTPTWNTTAGNLATQFDTIGSTTLATLSASDPDAGAVITYSVSSGSLPTGTTLNSSTGAISGTPSNVTSDTTYNFVAQATDNAGNNSTRSFNIIIKDDKLNVVDPLYDSSGLALYSMDNTINDLSGNYNGTLKTGSLVYSSSNKKLGTHSFTCNAANSFSVATIKNSYPFTLSTWIYVNPSLSGFNEVMNLSIAGQRVSMGLVDWDNNGTWQITLMYGGTNHWTFGGNIPKSSWVHVVWSVVGSNNSSHAIYLNGTAQSATNRGGGHGGTAGWVIGGNQDGAELFNGSIDQLRFFNKALSSSEVSALYAFESTR